MTVGRGDWKTGPPAEMSGSPEKASQAVSGTARMQPGTRIQVGLGRVTVGANGDTSFGCVHFIFEWCSS